MADKSASICFSLWNEQAAAIEGGDILKLTKGLSGWDILCFFALLRDISQKLLLLLNTAERL